MTRDSLLVSMADWVATFDCDPADYSPESWIALRCIREEFPEYLDDNNRSLRGEMQTVVSRWLRDQGKIKANGGEYNCPDSWQGALTALRAHYGRVVNRSDAQWRKDLRANGYVPTTGTNYQQLMQRMYDEQSGAGRGEPRFAIEL